MGSLPPNGPSKIQTFYPLKLHEIFKVSKYKRKIKIDKIWGYQNGGCPQTGSKKFKLHARHMKFSE